MRQLDLANDQWTPKTSEKLLQKPRLLRFTKYVKNRVLRGWRFSLNDSDFLQNLPLLSSI